MAATVTGQGPLGDFNPMGPLSTVINGVTLIGSAFASAIPTAGTYVCVPNTGTSINPTWSWI